MSEGPLISAHELATELDRFTVLDVRYLMGGPPGEDQHRNGHVPGAAYVDMDTELASRPAGPGEPGGRHPMPDVAVFGAAMRRALAARGFDLVVLDVGLPGREDGYVLARELKKERDIGILFLPARQDALDRIVRAGVSSRGYCFQIEMLDRAVSLGSRVVEVPITFDVRGGGESKMSGRIIVEALRQVTAWGVARRLHRHADRAAVQTPREHAHV